MKNIELKVAVKDFKEVNLLLNKIKAKGAGKLIQKDFYYICPNGRLKIREIKNKQFELIFYRRQDKKNSKLSDYQVLPLNKSQKQILKYILARACGELIAVKKIRNLWIYKHTRIHLDQVDKLGKFLELETVVKNINLKKAKIEHNEVIMKLNLSKYKKIDKSYSDLLIKKVRK